MPSPAAALELLSRAKQASGNRVIAFELIPEIGIQFTVKHMATRRAVETVADWYVLLEMADVAEGRG